MNKIANNPAALAPGAGVGKTGRPAGRTSPNNITRRFNQSLAVVARASVPAEVMMEYLLAIMQGHGQATIQRDDDGEWYVDWPELGTSSTPEQRQWAWTQWRQAAFGMPAQSIHLEADVRAQMATLSATVDVSKLEGRQAAALHMALRAALASASEPPALPASTDHAREAVIDVPSVPASAPVASSSSSEGPPIVPDGTSNAA